MHAPSMGLALGLSLVGASSQGDAAKAMRQGRFGLGDASWAMRPGQVDQGGAARALRSGQHGQGDSSQLVGDQLERQAARAAGRSSSGGSMKDRFWVDFSIKQHRYDIDMLGSTWHQADIDVRSIG